VDNEQGYFFHQNMPCPLEDVKFELYLNENRCNPVKKCFSFYLPPPLEEGKI